METQSLEEFVRRVKALLKHACDVHEWEGGRCDLHPLRVCSLWSTDHFPACARRMGKTSVIIYLIARQKVVCVIGLGSAVHCGSIPAQTYSGCEGVKNLISNHC